MFEESFYFIFDESYFAFEQLLQRHLDSVSSGKLVAHLDVFLKKSEHHLGVWILKELGHVRPCLECLEQSECGRL